MEGTWDAAPLLFPEEMEKPEVGLAASGLFASRVEAVERESTTVSAREQASLSLNVGDTSPLVDVERPQSRPTSLPEAGGSCGGAEQSGEISSNLGTMTALIAEQGAEIPRKSETPLQGGYTGLGSIRTAQHERHVPARLQIPSAG